MSDDGQISVLVDPGKAGDRAAAWNGAARAASGERLVLAARGPGDAEELTARHLEVAAGAGDLVILPGSVSMPRTAFLAVGGVASRRLREPDIGLAYRLVEAGCTPVGAARGAAAFAAAGRRSAECLAAHPALRRDLLGTFLSASPRDATIRRALIAIRVPGGAFATLCDLPRQEKLLGMGRRFAFWRGVRAGTRRDAWRILAGGVPVLMYHSFSADGEHDRFTLPRSTLRRQLRLLSRLGYRTIPLERLAKALREGEALPARCVAITIDDGYRDNREVAWPELRGRGFGATIFMVSDRLGGVNDWDDEGLPAGRPLLDADELRLLRDEGVGIGAHTRTHAHLPETDAAGTEAEVAGSRRQLEIELRAPVLAFAYPYGSFQPGDVDAVEAGGYLAACTTETRLAAPGDDPLAIPRIEVHDQDTTWSLLRKLWVGGS